MEAAIAGDSDGFEALTEAAPDLPSRPAPRVFELSARDLGSAAAAHLAEVFRDDSGLTTTLEPPAPAERAAFDAALPVTRTLLAEHAPEWAAELDLLAADLLLAVNMDRTKSGFAGASVFDAFGALLINPLRQTNPAELFMTLIHESAHSRLFLYHVDDPVLLNDGAARYRSPLRSQPRPMEGIFHAAWVSARMARAARDVLGSYRGAYADTLAELAASATAVFDDCQGVIDAEAEFTELGHALHQDARCAMRDG